MPASSMGEDVCVDGASFGTWSRSTPPTSCVYENMTGRYMDEIPAWQVMTGLYRALTVVQAFGKKLFTGALFLNVLDQS